MTEVSDGYLQRVRELHEKLGIPDSYRETCKLPLSVEPAELVDTELDYYQRPQKLTPSANAAWMNMRQAARDDGVILYLISAFRSIDYQCDLFQKKLADGQQLAEILRVIAAPGFSEHHTGRAVDLSTENCRALEVEFEKTSAFQWLTKRAGEFGFYLSYPVDNNFGITYEPWHWCYQA